MVGSINSNSLSGPQLASVSSASGDSTKASAAAPAAVAQQDTSRLSTLARQLSESATNAATRDASLSRKELGAKAVELLGQIGGDGYLANKAAHDAEVPATDDPELLARARNATEFVNGNGRNPFAGMSREQLSLIIYDDSGNFTVNERRAALKEDSRQEYAWRQKVVASAVAEYNETGKLTKFFTAALEHYKELPAIEQAQYPNSYEAKLQAWIALDFNYKTHTVEGQGSAQAILDKVLALDSETFDESRSGPAV
ncbi:hypothetical protein [Pseudomonas asplenii]|uniref:hypothetical protein n=1 Tax=Pseudomonas asplenii TaxID=53407 RepID=UPI0006866E28|nr:hypothetical protein [Pseudomonas fuscovaginae]